MDRLFDIYKSEVPEFLGASESPIYSMRDLDRNIGKVCDWIDAQKKSSKKRETKTKIENVGKVMRATIDAIEKIKSEDAAEIATGTLSMVSSAMELHGGCYGATVRAFCSIIGAIISVNKPIQSSVLEQLSECVDKNLTHFNSKLQDQKFSGLKRRILEQRHQLNGMTRTEELDDKALWNDYAQFLGELANRFEQPLPFLYKDLSQNPDVQDVVTALQKYCQAHICFLALLTVAKGRFEDLARSRKDIKAVERKIKFQIEDALRRLAFLSDDENLTFIAKLPSGEGKLTKILALRKNTEALSLVESVRTSLRLPEMPDLATVETKAEEVSRQSVELKLDSNRQRWSVHFINETNCAMRIVSGKVGWPKANLEFVKDVQPRSSHKQPCFSYFNPISFSTGGYLIIRYDNTPFEDLDPQPNDSVIEFALSYPTAGKAKINVEDKTGKEFTRGQYTYDHMTKSYSGKITYWKKRGVHYLATACHTSDYLWHDRMFYRLHWQYDSWQFLVQDFDPVNDISRS